MDSTPGHNLRQINNKQNFNCLFIIKTDAADDEAGSKYEVLIRYLDIHLVSEVLLPEPGTSLEVGEECGAVESVKAASEIYSPVSGTVTAKNEEVENGPALINAQPLTEGWLFK